jgi:hypothetical protein
MSVVIKKKQAKKVLPHSSEPLKVYSLKLPFSAQQFLDDLSQEASDNLGWTVSSSTILRVMLTYIQQQPSSWVAKSLYPLIEQEIEAGRVWGTKGKKGGK